MSEALFKDIQYFFISAARVMPRFAANKIAENAEKKRSENPGI